MPPRPATEGILQQIEQGLAQSARVEGDFLQVLPHAEFESHLVLGGLLLRGAQIGQKIPMSPKSSWPEGNLATRKYPSVMAVKRSISPATEAKTALASRCRSSGSAGKSSSRSSMFNPMAESGFRISWVICAAIRPMAARGKPTPPGVVWCFLVGSRPRQGPKRAVRKSPIRRELASWPHPATAPPRDWRGVFEFLRTSGRVLHLPKELGQSFLAARHDQRLPRQVHGRQRE